MAQYLTPGVYVEEVDRGPKPIAGVSTAVAAFVGFAEKGPREAMLITSWEQYRQTYGDFIEGAYMPTSVYGYFLNGGNRAYVMRVTPVVGIPANGSKKNSLEISPLLSAGDEDISVSIENTGKNRYRLTLKRGDLTETFDNLSSDKKDIEARYVEEIVNDPAKGSKIARVYDASGNRDSLDKRTPKAGTFTADGGDAKPAGELPAPAIRMNAAKQADLPVLEIKPNGAPAKPVTVTVSEVQGNDELFRIQASVDGGETENFEVSFKKGTQYLETVINGGRTASKLIRVKDLAPDSQLPPADRKPENGPAQHLGGAAKAETGNTLAVSSADFTGDVMTRTGVAGLEALDDVTIVLAPDLMTLYQSGKIDMKTVQVVQTALMNHCEAMKYRVALLDCPPDMTPQQIENWRMKEANYDSKYAALYYPWIEIDNPMQKGKTMFAPPSGHVAGVWARTDSERGVHKAPANEIIRGVIGLERQMTAAEQEGLNPNGINAIRAFPGRGIRIWGARTLSSDPSWKYLNVRRLFNFVEASIEGGTQWVVFEPNDADLWSRIRRDIGAFLYLTWSSGALFGATPDQAYFVKCDAEINTPASIDLGMVVTEIGISPVKPAEFVIFRIGQMSQQS